MLAVSSSTRRSIVDLHNWVDHILLNVILVEFARQLTSTGRAVKVLNQPLINRASCFALLL